MVVVGTVSQFLWGGDGWGIALRVERQETSRTTIGGELTGGRGSEGQYEDGTIFKQALVGLRAYGRTSPSNADEVAIAYGAGLSWLRTGAITATLQTSLIASYPNDHLVPLAALGLALAVPIVHGRAFGDKPVSIGLGEPEPQWDAEGRPSYEPPKPDYAVPKLDLYLGLDLGVIVPFGDTGNRLSLDIGAAHPMRSRSMLVSASAGDQQKL